MIQLQIKPLSVNQAWRGKRYKTPKYKSYEKDMLFLLPKIKTPDKFKEIHIHIVYGFSTKLSDIDNPCKPFLDCLVKKYGFDDRYITKLLQEKKTVKKGQEFIRFNIEFIIA